MFAPSGLVKNFLFQQIHQDGTLLVTKILYVV